MNEHLNVVDRWVQAKHKFSFQYYRLLDLAENTARDIAVKCGQQIRELHFRLNDLQIAMRVGMIDVKKNWATISVFYDNSTSSNVGQDEADHPSQHWWIKLVALEKMVSQMEQIVSLRDIFEKHIGG
jgi:hypothetical protein